LYGKRIAVGAHFLAAGYRERAEEVLDLCPQWLRHWEWRYLKRLCQPEFITLRGHTDLVLCVAISRDGTLASGGRDGMVKLWDLSTGKVLRTWKNQNWIACLAFSPDGRRLAWACEDLDVRVWDVRRRRELYRFSGAGTTVAFSPDGKHIATGG